MTNSLFNNFDNDNQRRRPFCQPLFFLVAGPTGATGGTVGPTGPTGPTHTLISESKIYFYRHFFNIMA